MLQGKAFFSDFLEPGGGDHDKLVRQVFREHVIRTAGLLGALGGFLFATGWFFGFYGRCGPQGYEAGSQNEQDCTENEKAFALHGRGFCLGRK